MATILSQVAYQEHPEYRESWTPNGAQVSRVVSCEWASRYQLVKDFVGTATVIGSSLSRSLPEFHPEFNWMPCLSMELVSIAGAPDNNNGTLRFRTWSSGALSAEARVFYRVVHQSVSYPILADGETTREYDRFVTKVETYATEALQIPGATYKWEVDDETIQETTTRNFFTKEVTYTWHQVPVYRTARIENGIAKVNSADWDGYDAETLLFLAPNKVIKRSAAGDFAYEITFKFMWRKDGWNKFFRRTGGSGPNFYSVVSRDGRGTKPYASYDFNELFLVSE